MRPGFWDMMFDSEYRQRGDINDALAMDMQLTSDVGALQTNVRSMADNLRQLSVTVAVLIEMLAEVKQVDPAEIRRRSEAMLAELMKPRAAPPAAPHVEAPRPPPLNTQPLTCIKCGRSVPANLTLMTENGPCCDPGCP